MSKIGMLFFRLWAYGLAITPFSLLYLRSDIYFFLVYHVARYRRKVVRQNLLKAFPEKEIKEIKAIERQFYHNLCDLAVEICKLLKMKPDELRQHFNFTNPEVVEELYKKQKNLFVASPHSGNWEWLGKIMHSVSAHKFSAIYKRLNNAEFDRFMLEIRTNYNLDHEQMIESRSVLKVLTGRSDLLNSILIVADQSPRGVATDYWTDFFHQDTCWFTGLERLAKTLDYAVVFAEMKRVRRGYYEVTFREICDNPKETEKGFIMEQYVRLLERFIIENPDNWLWSHRRWKHSR